MMFLKVNLEVVIIFSDWFFDHFKPAQDTYKSGPEGGRADGVMKVSEDE